MLALVRALRNSSGRAVLMVFTACSMLSCLREVILADGRLEGCALSSSWTDRSDLDPSMAAALRAAALRLQQQTQGEEEDGGREPGAVSGASELPVTGLLSVNRYKC